MTGLWTARPGFQCQVEVDRLGAVAGQHRNGYFLGRADSTTRPAVFAGNCYGVVWPTAAARRMATVALRNAVADDQDQCLPPLIASTPRRLAGQPSLGLPSTPGQRIGDVAM
jgi:hypothetical protein